MVVLLPRRVCDDYYKRSADGGLNMSTDDWIFVILALVLFGSFGVAMEMGNAKDKARYERCVSDNHPDYVCCKLTGYCP